MANTRRRHVGKTTEERLEYVNSVVGEAPRPTVETLPTSDATDSFAVPTPPLGQYAPTRTPGWPSKIFAYLRDNVGVIFGGLFLAALGGLYTFAWKTHDLASSLNREVGELKVELKGQRESSATAEGRLQAAINKFEERMEKDEDRVSRFIEESLRDANRRSEVQFPDTDKKTHGGGKAPRNR